MGPDDERMEDCQTETRDAEKCDEYYNATGTYSAIPDERKLDLAFARSTSDDKVIAVLVSLCI